MTDRKTPSVQELPELVGEFSEMARAYLRQETVGPAQQLGHYAGFAIGAGFLFSLAVLFFAVASVRAIIEWLPGEPSHQMWSALGYILTAVGLLIILAIIVKVASPDTEEG